VALLQGDDLADRLERSSEPGHRTVRRDCEAIGTVTLLSPAAQQVRDVSIIVVGEVNFIGTS